MLGKTVSLPVPQFRCLCNGRNEIGDFLSSTSHSTVIASLVYLSSITIKTTSHVHIMLTCCSFCYSWWQSSTHPRETSGKFQRGHSILTPGTLQLACFHQSRAVSTARTSSRKVQISITDMTPYNPRGKRLVVFESTEPSCLARR